MKIEYRSVVDFEDSDDRTFSYRGKADRRRNESIKRMRKFQKAVARKRIEKI